MRLHIYSIWQYFSTVVLAVGIAVFSLGDIHGDSTKFSFLGVLLISLGLLVEAFVSNYEERTFLNKQVNSSPAEVLYLSD